MKALFFLSSVLVFVCFGFCQSSRDIAKNADDGTILISTSENKKYGIEARFYGVELKVGEDGGSATRIIRSIVLKETKSGSEVKYAPTVDSSQAADFYFTNIWSPDEEYLVLPLGKFEGFALLKANDALNGVKTRAYHDTIKVKSHGSGWFWHGFEKWEGDSTIGFRAGLSGDMFAFQYNIKDRQLYCYSEECEESIKGTNISGDVKPLKKGDVAPTKTH